MTDLARLTEALERAIPGLDENGYTQPYLASLGVVFEAARLVVDGQDEERCITHNSTGRGPSPIGEACHYAALRLCSGFTHPPVKPCKWIKARLVFPKAEEKKETE